MGEHRAIASPLAQTYKKQHRSRRKNNGRKQIDRLQNKYTLDQEHSRVQRTLRCGHSSSRTASFSDDPWHKRCLSTWMSSAAYPFLPSSKLSRRTGPPKIHRVEGIPWMHCRKLEESLSCECRRTQRMLSDVSCQPAIF